MGRAGRHIRFSGHSSRRACLHKVNRATLRQNNAGAAKKSHENQHLGWWLDSKRAAQPGIFSAHQPVRRDGRRSSSGAAAAPQFGAGE
jgi:hypothetical protein